MGYYINPDVGTKEDFLMEHGTSCTVEEALNCDFYGDEWPVCLVHNDEFTAAGIGYDKIETEAFSRPMDMRLKEWFIVPRELLKPYFNRA
jgi:hypothetical protein